jgi:PBP1b-binding outer membrane lipoprotein LpoB
MKYLLIAMLITGCSSTNIANKSKTQKYLDKKIESTHRQFAFANNQIIILENAN